MGDVSQTHHLRLELSNYDMQVVRQQHGLAGLSAPIPHSQWIMEMRILIRVFCSPYFFPEFDAFLAQTLCDDEKKEVM